MRGPRGVLVSALLFCLFCSSFAWSVGGDTTPSWLQANELLQTQKNELLLLRLQWMELTNELEISRATLIKLEQERQRSNKHSTNELLNLRGQIASLTLAIERAKRRLSELEALLDEADRRLAALRQSVTISKELLTEYLKRRSSEHVAIGLSSGAAGVGAGLLLGALIHPDCRL